MLIGKIKWFNDAKGYGFIELEEGHDVFVHFSAVPGEENSLHGLLKGQIVSFELTEGTQGTLAKNVVRL